MSFTRSRGRFREPAHTAKLDVVLRAAPSPRVFSLWWLVGLAAAVALTFAIRSGEGSASVGFLFFCTIENVPAPENPKTSWLACYSALAALKSLQPGARYGT